VTFEAGLKLATARGFVRIGDKIGASHLQPLLETGRLTTVVQRADEMIPRLDAAEHHSSAVEARSALVRAQLELGIIDRANAERALTEGWDFTFLDLFAAAALAAAMVRFEGGDRKSAWASLGELAARLDGGATATREYVPLVPALVRCALALDDPVLARRLAAPVDDDHRPGALHVRAVAAAHLAEHDGEPGAAELFRDAAMRWESFGNRLEQAYALLGLGRTLRAVERREESVQAIEHARVMFLEMQARPRVAECDRLQRERAARPAMRNATIGPGTSADIQAARAPNRSA